MSLKRIQNIWPKCLDGKVEDMTHRSHLRRRFVRIKILLQQLTG